MIAVIDYGDGNLRSGANAIARLGYQPRITSAAQDLVEAPAIILPGVGAAGNTMESLQSRGLVDKIKKLIADNRPVFGVCIGRQVLFTSTEESGGHNCLGIIPGRLKKLPDALKVPHMGWNQVRQLAGHPLFEGIPDGADFYFVHSYYGEPEDKSLVVGETEYGITMGSVIARDNLVATQFHPEKSGEHGLKMYDNFIRHALAAEIP